MQPRSATLYVWAIAAAALSASCGGSGPQAGASAAAHGAASHGPHWTYTGAEGPARWGDLAPEFALCKTGARQTPIDLGSVAQMAAASTLSFAYAPVPLRVLNNGHTLLVEDTSTSSITLGPAPNERYKLVQLHVHSPSEHTIDRRAFEMELHLVHKNDAGELAVVGVLVAKGRESPVIAQILGNAPSEPSAEARIVAGVTVDIAALLPKPVAYFAYAGSLTTPPCTEGVKWFVLEVPHEASEAQIGRFREMMHGPTNRPVQPLGEREVLEWKP